MGGKWPNLADLVYRSVEMVVRLHDHQSNINSQVAISSACNALMYKIKVFM